MWTGIGTIGASALVGTGGSAALLPTLDAGRLDLEVNPWTPLRVRGGWRYLAPLAIDFDARSGVPRLGGAHHGDLGADYAISSWLVVGGLGGVGIDITTPVARGYVGPTLGLSQAFGTWGGLEVGYLEELGNFAGRSAYVSTSLSPARIVRIITRVSYFETEALGDSLRETTLMTLLDAPLLPWLSLRGRVQGSGALAPMDGSNRATPVAVLADVSVHGEI